MRKIKQGDWAKCGAYIFKFNPWTKRDIEYAGNQYDDGVEIKSEDCIKWIPKPSEWVIPDTGIEDDIFVVMKYNGVSLIPARCEPFIGELPSNLKGFNK